MKPNKYQKINVTLWFCGVTLVLVMEPLGLKDWTMVPVTFIVIGMLANLLDSSKGDK